MKTQQTTAIQQRVAEAAQFLKQHCQHKPKVGLVLGSGLSGIGDAFDGQTLEYSQIPGFPESTVAGHRGVLKVGPDVAIFLGRFHYYEGHPMSVVAFPIFLMKALGIQTVVLTNAAGGVNPQYQPGQLVLINDHISFQGNNPFIGPHMPEWGPRFFDMSDVYTKSLRQKTQALATKLFGKPLDEGVYMAFTGPAYETPAEVRMAKTLGASLVGMSTAPEATAAASCGLQVVGISVCTNLAAGVGTQKLDHSEVVEYGKKAEGALKELLTNLVRELS